VYVPLDATAAPRAAIALGAAGPWRLVELGLVDFPDAAWTGKERQRHGATDLQQLSWPDDRHASALAWSAIVARAAAAETRGSKAAIGPEIKVDQPPCAVAARTVPIDVAYRLEGKLAEHGMTRCAQQRVPMSAVTARCGLRARPPCAPWKQSLASQGLPPPQPFPAQSPGPFLDRLGWMDHAAH